MRDPKRIAPFFLQDVSKEAVINLLEDQGFERDNGSGCLTKKARFRTLLRYRYSVIWVRAEQCTWDSLVDAMSMAVGKYTSQSSWIPRKGECLLLFAETEIVSEKIRKMMEKLSRDIIQETEELGPTLIHILVEGSTGQGCYWAPTINVGDYARGCGLLRKCLR